MGHVSILIWQSHFISSMCKWAMFPYLSDNLILWVICVNGPCFHNYLANPFLRSVVGEMKVGNIVPSAGIIPTSLAFQVSVLTITPPRLLDVTTLPTCMQLLAWELSADSSPWICKPFNAYNYIQALALHIHRAGSTTIQCIASTGSWS